MSAITTWLEAVEQADIVSAPQDFLAAFGALLKRLDRLEAGEDPQLAASLLTALSTCEFIMAEQPTWTTQAGVPPVQPLDPEWLPLVGDDSAEFRLAAALNSIRPLGVEASESTRIRPFRAHLEPIDYRWDQRAADPSEATDVAWDWKASDDVLWDKEEDVDGLNAVAARRLKHWDGAPKNFAAGAIAAPLAAVDAFLREQTKEADFSRLAFTLSLVESWRLGGDPLTDALPALDAPAAIDPVYSLARLAFTGYPLGPDSGPEVPLNRDIHLLADRGDTDSTVEFARAHLRKHGYTIGRPDFDSEIDVRRIGAALLFPISDADRAALAKNVELTAP